jgi:hypothetical protein
VRAVNINQTSLPQATFPAGGDLAAMDTDSSSSQDAHDASHAVLDHSGVVTEAVHTVEVRITRRLFYPAVFCLVLYLCESNAFQKESKNDFYFVLQSKRIYTFWQFLFLLVGHLDFQFGLLGKSCCPLIFQF